MKKFVALMVLVVMMMTTTAWAEPMRYSDFCESTKIGEVMEQSDGTYKMVMETINGYMIVITAPVYETQEGDVLLIYPDGNEEDLGHWTTEDASENMEMVFNWMYEDYRKGWA